MSASHPVTIRLLDREYTVGCEPGEENGLLAAAKLLDTRMREIRGSNRMAALDRVAVLAALNLAHEVQQAREASEALDRGVDQALGELRQRLARLVDEP